MTPGQGLRALLGGKPHTLKIRYYDDESTPARGIEVVERLIQQDGVKFMLGSGLTEAILPFVERHKVPMVEANGAARELFAKGYHYIFAVLTTSDQYLTPPLIWPRGTPRSFARNRKSSRSPWRWRTIRLPKTCGPACSPKLSVSASIA